MPARRGARQNGVAVDDRASRVCDRAMQAETEDRCVESDESVAGDSASAAIVEEN